MVSFTWPWEEPVKDFRILTQVEASEVMVEMWGEKVTPRILGALSRGTMSYLWSFGDGAWIGGCQGWRVTEDLVGTMERLWEEDQLVMEERWLFRMDTAQECIGNVQPTYS